MTFYNNCWDDGVGTNSYLQGGVEIKDDDTNPWYRKIARQVQLWRDTYDFAFPPVYKMDHTNGVGERYHNIF